MPRRALSFLKRGSYFDVSRAPRYSVLFALPLLIAYEALAAALAGPRSSSQVRNGADVLLTSLFTATLGGPLVRAAAFSYGLNKAIKARRGVKSEGKPRRPRRKRAA